MMRRLIGVTIATAALAWAAAVMTSAAESTAKGASRLGGQQAPQGGRVDFERQVQPIIADHCLECHSQDKRKGGLSLATYADALEGGRNGPAIRPGSSARSILLHRLTGAVEPQMPKDENPLSRVQVALIRRWIDQGARATATSPPAPPPWEAPLALTRPHVPTAIWPASGNGNPTWSSPMRSSSTFPRPN